MSFIAGEYPWLYYNVKGNAAFNLPHYIQRSLSVEDNNQKYVAFSDICSWLQKGSRKEEREGREDRKEREERRGVEERGKKRGG